MKVANEDNFKEVSDLQGKMRKLQKHQAFEAEIVANTDRIDKIKQVGQTFCFVFSLYQCSMIQGKSKFVINVCKAISDSLENYKIINFVVLSIIVNYQNFIIKLWMGSVYM